MQGLLTEQYGSAAFIQGLKKNWLDESYNLMHKFTKTSSFCNFVQLQTCVQWTDINKRAAVVTVAALCLFD